MDFLDRKKRENLKTNHLKLSHYIIQQCQWTLSLAKMANTFYFFTDSQNHLLEVFIGGSVLSYIAVIFNIFIFLILFRKKLSVTSNHCDARFSVG